MSGLLLVAALALVAPAPDEAPLNDARHANVVLLLRGDAELAAAHAGYWQALQQRPEWLELEAVYWELARSRDTGPLLALTDEWFHQHPEAQGLYDRAGEALAAEAELRRAFEEAGRGLLETRGDPRTWLNATRYLQANPVEALRFLEGVDEQTVVPDALKPYALDLYDPGNWSSLREGLKRLTGAASAGPVLEWWKNAAVGDSEQPPARLALHFLQRPTRFWAWQRREVALAAEPSLRDWTRWWQRRMRRERLPHAQYLSYLLALKAGQEQAPPSAGDVWPPAGAPPELAPVPLKTLDARLSVAAPPSTPEVARPGTPKRPEVSRPEVQRPERPEKPVPRESTLTEEREP
ncbi:MAG: hypothetical protein RLZZ303_1727 [Candidatus Hydrogenedentota bacterium]|jgi:hypothetical protein